MRKDPMHLNEDISVIIPCYPPDIAELPTMIASLVSSTYLPGEIIVCLSETSDNEGNALERKFSGDFKFPVTFCTTPEKQFAGQNRNRGAKIAKCGILVFCDADDICHPQKLEITKTIFDKYRPALFLHNFLRKSSDFKRYDIGKIPLVFTKTLFDYTFGAPPRRHNSEWIFTDRPAMDKPAEGFHPHHGYAAVKKEVFEKVEYPATQIAEDSEFCLEVLWKFRNAVFADIGLVNYIKDL